MDRKQIKEKARYTFIREKANQLQEKSRHTSAVPGAFTVIDGARRIEQCGSDPEGSSSATDSIERAGITAASGAERAARHAKRTRQRNAFHRETHYEGENSVSPQDQMRAKAVNDYKAQRRQKRAETLSLIHI